MVQGLSSGAEAPAARAATRAAFAMSLLVAAAGVTGVTTSQFNVTAGGEVDYVTYHSEQSLLPGGQHPVGVYLPPAWDPDRDDPYPLLVLSHGAGGDEKSWFDAGGAAEILDAAIAADAMPPAVVVTTLFEELTDAQMLEPAFYDAYAAELHDSVLPFVQERYNVSAARADRSFGGLSMGGGLGLFLLIDHPDLFARYGLWSAAADLGESSVATPTDLELERMAQAHVIHMGTGVHDELWGIGALSQERAALYRDLGLPIVINDIDGGHTWDVWRQQLDHFVRDVAFEQPEPKSRRGRTAVLVLAIMALASASVAGAIAAKRGVSESQ